jgi:DNA gyrase subunit B
MVYEVVDNAIDEALAGFAKEVLVQLNGRFLHRARRRPRHPGRHPQAKACRRPKSHDSCMPGKSTRTPIRCPAGTGRRLRRQRAVDLAEAHHLARRHEHSMEFATARRRPTRHAWRRHDKRAPRHVPAVDGHLHHDGVGLRDAGTPVARARVPQFRDVSDNRHAVEKREELRYEGGVEAFVKYLDCNKTAFHSAADHDPGRARRGDGRLCAVVERRLPRVRACFTNILQRDGGTHPPASRAAHAPDNAYGPGGVARKEKVALTGAIAAKA